MSTENNPSIDPSITGATLLEWINVLHGQLRKAARLHSLGIITGEEYLRAVNEARSKARKSTGLEPLAETPSPITVLSFPGILPQDTIDRLKAQLAAIGLKVMVIEEGSTLCRLDAF